MATDQNLIDALDAVITKANATAASSTPEELVYLGKALEAVGPASTTRFIVEIGESERARIISVGDAKIAELSTGLKTINGEAIQGSGDIDTKGLLQTVANSYSGHQSFSSTAYTQTGVSSGVFTPAGGTSSKFIVNVHLEGEWNHERQWKLYRSIDGGSYQECPWGTGTGSPNYGVGHFVFDYDVDNSSTIHNTNGQYIDSPSASSSIEYRVYIRVHSGSMWLNRTVNGNPYSTGICRVTVMEVAV